MNKSKGWIVAMAMAAAMGAWAQDKNGEHPGGGPGDHHWGHEDGMHMGPMNPRVLHELNLTPDQEKKFKDMRLVFEKKKIQIHSDRAMLEVDLRNVLDTYPVNQGQAMKIGEKIAELEKKAALLRVEGISQFLSGLTAEQHAKLLELQAEFREKHRDWHGEDDKDKDKPDQ